MSAQRRAGLPRVSGVRRLLGGTLSVGAALVVAVLVAGLVAGVVGAVMTLGAGTGTASTATAVSVTLSPATGGADLKPAGQGAVRLVATNPHEAEVAVNRLVLDTGRGTGGFTPSASGCPASAFSFTSQTNAGAGWRVPARSGGTDGRLTIALPGALSMSAGAPDGCQAVTVTVFLTASS